MFFLQLVIISLVLGSQIFLDCTLGTCIMTLLVMLKTFGPLENWFVVVLLLFFCCCCRQPTLLGSKHKSWPTFYELWFQYYFPFPRSFQCHSVYPHMCHQRAVVYAVVKFWKPLLWFHKGVPHMLSSGVISDFTHGLRSSFSLPLAPPWLIPQSVSQAPFLDPLPTLVFWLPSLHISCNLIQGWSDEEKGGKSNSLPTLLRLQEPLFQSLWSKGQITIQD